jgi:hypothetical protein
MEAGETGKEEVVREEAAAMERAAVARATEEEATEMPTVAASMAADTRSRGLAPHLRAQSGTAPRQDRTRRQKCLRRAEAAIQRAPRRHHHRAPRAARPSCTRSNDSWPPCTAPHRGTHDSSAPCTRPSSHRQDRSWRRVRAAQQSSSSRRSAQKMARQSPRSSKHSQPRPGWRSSSTASGRRSSPDHNPEEVATAEAEAMAVAAAKEAEATAMAEEARAMADSMEGNTPTRGPGVCQRSRNGTGQPPGRNRQHTRPAETAEEAG